MGLITRLYDLGFSARISSLVITLEEKISEKNTHSQNIDAAEKIESIIARFNSESEVKTYATLCNPVVQMMEIAYRYHMLAYSGDMIKNLGGEHSPFRFDELEFELPLTWQNRLIKLSEIQEFFKEEDTLTFCFQKKMDCPRPEKAIRGNAFSFVSNLIEFEQSLIEDGQQRLFTVAYNNEIYIPADRAALIVKTYLDLDLQEKLKMKYYNGSDWKSEQSLKRALSPANKLATDLAMRLFIVAFHSEYLNAHQGYGYYWPLFKCIYLSQYLLLQKIVFACFSGVNQEEWIRRFKDIQDNISRI